MASDIKFNNAGSVTSRVTAVSLMARAHGPACSLLTRVHYGIIGEGYIWPYFALDCDHHHKQRAVTSKLNRCVSVMGKVGVARLTFRLVVSVDWTMGSDLLTRAFAAIITQDRFVLMTA